ncbi:MAG: hypothetical protein ABF289_12015 [Clostridiales bacterium]
MKIIIKLVIFCLLFTNILPLSAFSNDYKYMIKLVDSNGNGLESGKVSYIVNGKWTSIGTTNKDGIISFNASKATKYKFKMQYAGGTIYKYHNLSENNTVDFKTIKASISLKDSKNNPLSNGLVSYVANGKWSSIDYTDSKGIVNVELLPTKFKFRMQYAGGRINKYQDLSSNSKVNFKTINSTISLLDSKNTPLKDGLVSYVSDGKWQTIGSTDSTGSINIELLPVKFKFRMQYAGGKMNKYQNISSDSSVIFNTVNSAISLLNSKNTPLKDGLVSYVADGKWLPIDSTNANGLVNVELLPVKFKFRIQYAGGIINKYQNLLENNNVLFQTVPSSISLSDSNNKPLKGGIVSYVTNGKWESIGTTNSKGLVNTELLPTKFKFKMNYEGGTVNKYQNLSSDTNVPFKTVSTNINLIDNDNKPISDSLVSYVANGKWQPIDYTNLEGKIKKEMLPTNYKFRVESGGKKSNSYQNLKLNSNIFFQYEKGIFNKIIKVNKDVELNLVNDSVTHNSASLSWEFSPTDYNIKKYSIYKNGKLLAKTKEKTFTDSDLKSSTEYNYQVVSSSTNGITKSNPLTIKTKNSEYKKNIELISEKVEESSATIIWSDDIKKVYQYEVYKNNKLISTIDTKEYEDKTLESDTTYEYIIKAIDSNKKVLGESNKLEVITKQSIEDKVIPFDLEAVDIYSNSVVLNWKVESQETWINSYNILRNDKIIGTSEKTDYTDLDLNPEEEYEYKIQVIGTSGNVLGTSKKLIVTTKEMEPNLSVLVKNITETSVSLTWSEPETSAKIDLYKIYRNGELVKSTETFEYLDLGLESNNLYEYKITAVNNTGRIIKKSEIIEVSTLAFTEQATIPENLQADNITPSGLTLTWSIPDNDTKIMFYEIIRNDETIEETNTTKFVDLSLQPNTNYTYKIKVFGFSGNEIGESEPFSVKTNILPKEAPLLENPKSLGNLAITGSGRKSLFVADQFENSFNVMSDEIKVNGNSADSWNNELHKNDYWGMEFDTYYGFNKVIYTAGHTGNSGGWFDSDLKVQVRQYGTWVDVKNINSDNEYPYNNTAGPDKSYDFSFDDTWGDAIRVIGIPVKVNGYNYTFTSIEELEIYYEDGENSDSTDNNSDQVDSNVATSEYDGTLANIKNSDNIAQTADSIEAIYAVDQFNNSLSVMTDGGKAGSSGSDSWNGQLKTEDYWGLGFNKVYGFNQVIYTQGDIGQNGGWFDSNLKVQVRQNGAWKNVSGISVGPDYPYDITSGPDKSYTFNFDDTWGDAIRIIGTPYKSSDYEYSFTSIKEFEVYYSGNSSEDTNSDQTTNDYKNADNTIPSDLENSKSYTDNIARTGNVLNSIYAEDQFNNSINVMTNGAKVSSASSDSWNGEIRDEDYWGLVFNGNYGFNKIVFTSGHNGLSGGWFESNLKVQVRQNGVWKNATTQNTSPQYPYTREAGPDKNYTIAFDDTWGDAIRIIGKPVKVEGYDYTYTSIQEFEVYYDGVSTDESLYNDAEAIDSNIILSNRKSNYINLARLSAVTNAVYVTDQFNNALSVMTNGAKVASSSADSWNGSIKKDDFWGISFNNIYGFNKVVFTTGHNGDNGGYFEKSLMVQVKQNGEWKNVTNLSTTPDYPYSKASGPDLSYTFTFDDTWGDSIRIIGNPAKIKDYSYTYTSIQEFEAYYEGEELHLSYAEGINDSTTVGNQKNGDNISITYPVSQAVYVYDQFKNAMSVLTQKFGFHHSADSWNGQIKTEDYWGLIFDKNYGYNKVVYIAGHTGDSGGWFTSDLRVQVRQNGVWKDARNVVIDPYYPYGISAQFNQYTFTFDDTWGDGIRIIGIPVTVDGKDFSFTSIMGFKTYFE